MSKLHGDPVSGLSERLAWACDVRAAARLLVEHLAEVGLPLPSVYLERGGRLRCQAQHGYWQVQDGIPPTAGVLGATYASGRSMRIRPEAFDGYLEAATDVVDEVCVPVRHAERVVGVISVESRHLMPDDALAVTERAAAVFERRLAELGGREPESQSQKLVRHTIAIAQRRDADGVQYAALEAAVELTGMHSAAVVLFDDDGTPRVRTQIGPLADPSFVIGDDDLRGIAAWVESGTSCYTVGDPHGAGFAGHEFFRLAGALAVVVVPLVARSRRMGWLMVADSAAELPVTDVVERLELLAAQTAASLVTAVALDELVERASRDPLTGLGHHASFHEALEAALRRQRTGRNIAVLLCDVDCFKLINDTQGHVVGDEVLVAISRAMSDAVRDGDALYRVGGDEFATVVEVTEPAEAVAVAERIRLAVARTGSSTTSVGVAVACPDESVKALLARADEALYDVKARGRDGVLLHTGHRPAQQAQVAWPTHHPELVDFQTLAVPNSTSSGC